MFTDQRPLFSPLEYKSSILFFYLLSAPSPKNDKCVVLCLCLCPQEHSSSLKEWFYHLIRKNKWGLSQQQTCRSLFWKDKHHKEFILLMKVKLENKQSEKQKVHWTCSFCLLLSLFIHHLSSHLVFIFSILLSSPCVLISSFLGPSSLKSIHCFPLSSSSLSCSWSPPHADFDSYEVECRRYDDRELISALKLVGGVTAVTLDHLEPYRKYSVTVRVSSAGQTSPPVTHTTVTMIDREFKHTLTRIFIYIRQSQAPNLDLILFDLSPELRPFKHVRTDPEQSSLFIKFHWPSYW